MALTPPQDRAGAAMPALEDIREVAPDVHRRLAAANAVALESVDPALFELMRLRIQLTLDPESALEPGAGSQLSAEKLSALQSWADSPLFSDVERALLALVEQFVFYVAGVDDALIDDLLVHLPPDEVYGLVNALYVLDATERLHVSLDRLFHSTEVTA